MKLLLLCDWCDGFYSSTKQRGGSMDTVLLRKLFERYGYEVDIKRFSEIQYEQTNYKDTVVLYQSSEDTGLYYKDYIEDVLLGLQLRGATLVPDIYKFRAHHNKVFMEIYRDVMFRDILDTNIYSLCFGTLEDYHRHGMTVNFPVVFKPSEGSRSKGVKLLTDARMALWAIKRHSFTPTIQNVVRRILCLVKGGDYKKMTHYRKKFIVQNFVHGLSGDYKILVYSNKYYVLWRENRTNDFRASGSGRLSFPEMVPSSVLDFANSVFRVMDAPFASIDVGVSHDGQLHLLEFQFIMFGQYALERTCHYFVKVDSVWQKINQKTVLEEQFAESIHNYISGLTDVQ